MTEQWLPALGWEGFYEVSNLGQVKSVERRARRSGGHTRLVRERILSQNKGGKGYLQVTLNRSNIGTKARVAILVCEAFHGPRPEGMWVLHGDGNKLNNFSENLRWGTPSENNLDTVEHGNHHWANKEMCPKDHPYTQDNTYIYRGRRNCRKCHAESNRSYRERIKEAQQ